MRRSGGSTAWVRVGGRVGRACGRNQLGARRDGDWSWLEFSRKWDMLPRRCDYREVFGYVPAADGEGQLIARRELGDPSPNRLRTGLGRAIQGGDDVEIFETGGVARATSHDGNDDRAILERNTNELLVKRLARRLEAHTDHRGGMLLWLRNWDRLKNCA